MLGAKKDCCALAWQAAKHPTAVRSLPALQWDGEENGKKGKTHEFILRQFNRTEKEEKIIVIIMIKEHTKQVMHNGIAHDPLTDAQPVPEQQLLPPCQLPQFIYEA